MPAEYRLAQYAQTYKAGNRRVMMLISALLLMLGLLGVLWAVPFPHLKFLGRYNGFINWASFFIAIAGYYYYRISAVIGYIVILILFAFAYLVTCMQNWQYTGGPPLLLFSCILIAAALLIALLINKRLLGRVTIFSAMGFLVIAPAWFASILFKKRLP